MNHYKIAIIGGGNPGVAIATGILKSGDVSAENITVTRRNISALLSLTEAQINVSNNNKKAVSEADIVFLAVKPYQIMEVLKEIREELSQGKVLISAVTGVTIAEMRECILADIPIFRAMPNTAIAIGQSMTCISYSNASTEQANQVISLFSYLGEAILIDEGLMEAATVLGACGTAFAMRYIRANIQGGIEIGFDAATARLIAAQTIRGAAELLLINGTHPESEIDKVTRPKGCTIAGLNEMEHQGFSSSLIRGLIASYRKIGKMVH